MSDLQNKLIRLAHTHPGEVQAALLPLLEKAAKDAAMRKPRAPGAIWQTAAGKWRAVSLDGKAKSFDKRDGAKDWGTSYADPENAEKAKRKKNKKSKKGSERETRVASAAVHRAYEAVDLRTLLLERFAE